MVTAMFEINSLLSARRLLVGASLFTLAACQTIETPRETASDNPLTLHHATIHERGAVFRATGNEPGWVVEIDRQEQLSFVGNYGAFGFQAPAQRLQQPDGTVQYDASQGQHRLHLVIREQRCQDTMSDDQFPLTVTVWLDGQGLRGCGWYVD